MPRHAFALIALALLTAGCGGDPSTTTAPASAPARPVVLSDWPAFSGGGPLRAEAPAITSPPYRVAWQYKTNEVERAAVEGGPVIVKGVVYVGDAYSTLHAIDAATGKRLWQYTHRGPDNSEGGFSTTPLVKDGVVYVGDSLGILHAVNAADGTRKWIFDTESPINASPNISDDMPDRLVFGNDAAEVHCVRLVDGKPMWKQKIGDRVNAALSVYKKTAFVSGCDAKLRAYSLVDGKELTTAELGALTGGSAAVIDEFDAIVVGTDQGRVLSFTLEKLATRWQYEGIEDKAMVYASPAIGGGLAVLGARDRNVHAVDLATGQQKWVFKTRGDVDATAVIAGELVFVGSKDKKLYVLDLRTGQEKWQFQASRGITAPVAIAHLKDGPIIVVGDTAGNIYGLR